MSEHQAGCPAMFLPSLLLTQKQHPKKYNETDRESRYIPRLSIRVAKLHQELDESMNPIYDRNYQINKKIRHDATKGNKMNIQNK